MCNYIFFFQIFRSTTVTTLASKFTPIAPAPAKISWTNQGPQMTTAPQAHQPAQMSIMFQQQPNSNLPILTQGPNGTMILVQPNTFTFPQPQFMFPTVNQFQQAQPLLYGIQPTFLQPQVQTTFITQQQLNNSQQKISSASNSAAEEITILSSQPNHHQQVVSIPNHQQQGFSTQNCVKIQQNPQKQQQMQKTIIESASTSVKKFDILERAILEIANLGEETKHQY